MPKWKRCGCFLKPMGYSVPQAKVMEPRMFSEDSG
jgi:hypothetical protein